MINEPNSLQAGFCVQIPDGRIGRVREVKANRIKVRVMRTTSHTHQFVWFAKSELKLVTCPKGWMSPGGYNRYLEITIKKMKQRSVKKHEK